MTYLRQFVLTDTSGTTADVESNNALAVNIQDQHSEAFALYLWKTNVTPSMTVGGNIDDTSITVDSIVGVNAGDVITMFDGTRHYQSLITGTAPNTINLAAPLDYAFTTGSTIEIGDWKMNVDGSGPPVTFVAHTPWEADVYSIQLTMGGAAAMDSQKFGDIPVLTNGFALRQKNSITKNLLLAIHNKGLANHGFVLQYDDRAGGGGEYLLQAYKSYPIKHGVSLRLEDSNDEIQAIVQDDLTGMDYFVCIIMGHKVID